MSLLAPYPIGPPVPHLRDHSARDGGAWGAAGVIPRDVLVVPAARRAPATAPPTPPLTPYDDPAHLLALAARDREVRCGLLAALLVTAVLTSLAYWWL